MARVFFGISALLFFFAAVGVTVIPHPTDWGFVCLAIGMLLGGIPFPSFHKNEAHP